MDNDQRKISMLNKLLLFSNFSQNQNIPISLPYKYLIREEYKLPQTIRDFVELLKRNLNWGQWNKSEHLEELDYRLNDILLRYPELMHLLSSINVAPVGSTMDEYLNELYKILEPFIDENGDLQIKKFDESYNLGRNKKEAKLELKRLLNWLKKLFSSNLDDVRKNAGLFNLSDKLLR